MSPIAAKTYTTEVICLRAIDFGEADKILHLYSPEHGRISAIAKGVKKQKSKLAGACEVLNVSEVQLSKGKNLDVLCQYQPRESFSGLRSDLLKLAYGLLFAELVYTATADVDADSHQVYSSLKQALKRLDGANEAEVSPLAIDYQLAFLHAAGFHPVLNECVLSGRPLPSDERYYCFSAQLGGVTTLALKKRQQAETGGFGMQWVNVSPSTLAILGAPSAEDWELPQYYKAQKFLQYYFKQVFERQLHAYDLVFNLLDMSMPLAEDKSAILASPA